MTEHKKRRGGRLVSWFRRLQIKIQAGERVLTVSVLLKHNNNIMRVDLDDLLQVKCTTRSSFTYSIENQPPLTETSSSFIMPGLN